MPGCTCQLQSVSFESKQIDFLCRTQVTFQKTKTMHDASLQYPRQPAMRSQPTSCVPHYPFHPVKSHVLEPMKAHRHQQNDSPERITQFNFNCQRAKKRVQKNTQTKHIISHNACHVYKNAMIDEKHQK